MCRYMHMSHTHLTSITNNNYYLLIYTYLSSILFPVAMSMAQIMIILWPSKDSVDCKVTQQQSACYPLHRI